MMNEIRNVFEMRRLIPIALANIVVTGVLKVVF